MINLEFSYNETTYNSKITLIEKIDLEKVNLKIDFLKSFDDEDYYEFEDFENFEINNLNFKLSDGDMYEVTFDVKYHFIPSESKKESEKAKTLLLEDIYLEISQLEKLIDNDIMLKAIRDFEQLHYNYDNIDLIW